MKREYDGPKLRTGLVDTALLHKFAYRGRRASSDNHRSSQKPPQFLTVSIVLPYFFSLSLFSIFEALGFHFC